MRALALILLAACGQSEAPAAPPPPEMPQHNVESVHTPTKTTEARSPLSALPDEACAQVIVVAWQGAAHAASTVTRTQAEARARAEELRTRLDGAEFADLARSESDAASSGPRGGLIGTYRRGEWPEAHAAIRDPIFNLQVGQTSEVIEASYGYAIARRCPVEKIHTRHVLIRYAGARNAGADVVRAKEAARVLATEIRSGLMLPGADFEAVARQRSEDSTAAQGGDVGIVGRGRLAPEYEAAAFALAPGQVSDVVETEFGYHVIQRVE